MPSKRERKVLTEFSKLLSTDKLLSVVKGLETNEQTHCKVCECLPNVMIYCLPQDTEHKNSSSRETVLTAVADYYSVIQNNS